ncbi:hypothetical protein GUJ93_ZPchr0006g45254 [Zizania palustris]|uniref:Uncharacterized protein n=1 Tax=Zizania palustris TaxID=103762 RepID=A0A8J5VM03_ZIZPA|nr:hypothetical protein GUJ93_ZPchr0006g45254 [Zizania palustris]
MEFRARIPTRATEFRARIPVRRRPSSTPGSRQGGGGVQRQDPGKAAAEFNAGKVAAEFHADAIWQLQACFCFGWARYASLHWARQLDWKGECHLALSYHHKNTDMQ